MSDTKGTRIALIGAGLAGSLMACYLGRDGYDVTVYEKLPDPRIGGFVGGRSINLALSERGLHALREVGLADEALKRVIPMPGRMIHSPTGKLAFQAYSDNPNDRINSISRGELSILLINAASKYPNVRFVFDHRCTNIDFKRPAITFLAANKLITIDTDVIIGADGAFSAVRLQMMLNMDRFEYRQEYLEHGYKELTIPPFPLGRGDGGEGALESARASEPALTPALSQRAREFAMNPNALHIWPRGGYMMIALPNQDKSFTCTCFWPFSGPNGFDALTTDDDIRRYFSEHFPDAVPLMPTLVEDYKRNPTSSLVTIHCWPWHFGGKAVLIGDAAHAIVPFYGQGMNCAFEDCSVLAEMMRHVERDKLSFADVFRSFAQQRKPNTDAIAEMALHNFIEMRDKTASPLFRTRKKIEHALHGLLPRWFTPLYNMISFTTIPYAEARRKAKAQARNLAIIVITAILIVILLIVLPLAA